jgi:hypothetical protein
MVCIFYWNLDGTITFFFTGGGINNKDEGIDCFAQLSNRMINFMNQQSIILLQEHFVFDC